MFMVKSLFVTSFLIGSVAYSQIGNMKISKLTYSHATVGTTAQDAISAASVERELKAWTLCHDSISGGTYLSFSDTADPDTTGQRLAAGQCFSCESCSFGTLRDLNVKGQNAGTAYSIVQKK